MALPSSSSSSSNGNGSSQSPLYSLLFAGGSKSTGTGESAVAKLLLKPPLLINSEIPARFERYNSLEAKSPRLTASRGGSNHTTTRQTASTNYTPHSSASPPPPALSPSSSSPSAPFISRIPVYSPSNHQASPRTPNKPESRIPVFKDSQLLRRAHSSKATPKPQITIVKRTASSRNYYHHPGKELNSSNNSLNNIGQQQQLTFHRFSPVAARSSNRPSIFLNSPQSLGSKIPSKSVLNIQKIDDLKDILSGGSIGGSQILAFERKGGQAKSKKNPRANLLPDQSDESDEPKSSTPSDSDSTESSSSSPLTPAFETASFTRPLFSSQLNHHSLMKKSKTMDDPKGLEKPELGAEPQSVQITSKIFSQTNHTSDAETVSNFEAISKNIQNLETKAKLVDENLSKSGILKHSLSEEEFATMEQLLDKNEQIQVNKTFSSSASSKSSLKRDVEEKIDYPEISPIPGSIDLGAIAEKILNTQKRPSLNSAEGSKTEKLSEEEEKVITTAELKSIEPSPQAQKALQKSKTTQRLTLTIAKPQPSTKEINLEEIAEKIITTPAESGSLSPKRAIFLDPPLSPPLSPHLVSKPPLPPTTSSSTSTLKQRPSFNRPENLNLKAPQSTATENTSGRPKSITTTTTSSSSKLIITTESYSKTYASLPSGRQQSPRPTSSSSSLDSSDPLSPGFGTLKRFHVTGSPVSETRKFFSESAASLNTCSAGNGQVSDQSSALPSPVAVLTPVASSVHDSEVASINSNIEQIAAISFDLQSQSAYSEHAPQASTSKFPVASNNGKTTTKKVTTAGGKAEPVEVEGSSKPATKKKSKWKRFVKKLKFWKHE